MPDDDGIFVTSAQGEGAIEGTIDDYYVGAGDEYPFATRFAFTRFGKSVAPPVRVATQTRELASHALGVTSVRLGRSATPAGWTTEAGPARRCSA